jgi:hypothetical protein
MGVILEANVTQASLNRAAMMLRDVKGGVGRAVSGAINDLMKQSRTQIAKLTSTELNLKYGRILKAMTISRATPANLSARLKGTSKDRPGLASFGAKDSKKRGVTYKISRKGGRKRIPNAFMAKGRYANSETGLFPQLVYARYGKPAYKIRGLKGVSINRTIRENKFDEVVRSTIIAKLPGRVHARVRLLISRTKSSAA